MPDQEFYPAALTIAGSDSGGGAGIQADLRSFAAFGVYGCSVITAITAQNPRNVSRVDAAGSESVNAQLTAVFDAFAIAAIKTGMLFEAGIIQSVVEKTRDFPEIPLIVDPVMVASSGAVLLQKDAVTIMRDKLLPQATWITPNIPEMELLLEVKIDSIQAMRDTAMEAARRWQCCCILKGGHAKFADSGLAQDVVARDGKMWYLSSPMLEEAASHGTGCTFSAALAAGLALGLDWQDALRAAKGFVYGSLVEAVPVGPGTEAMYPPGQDYGNKIKLEKIK